MNNTHIPHKLYSLTELQNLELGKTTKPALLKINETALKVKNWTNLMELFISFLIEEGLLTKDKTPIYNHAKRDKYLINTNSQHKIPERNGSWKQINIFYIDVKYNAEAHIKNIVYLSEVLGLRDKINVRISFN
jgi:hypothetical protein